MTPENLDICGFDDCMHVFALHLRTEHVSGVYWHCIAPGCHCHDFAQPGSVVSLGDVGLELGDSELN